MAKSLPDLRSEPSHAIRTRGEKVFSVFNAIVLIILGVACALPFW